MTTSSAVGSPLRCGPIHRHDPARFQRRSSRPAPRAGRPALSPRIAWYVHGRGRGHASRALHGVPALRARGFQVAVLGGGDAEDLLLRMEGWRPARPILPGPREALRVPARVAEDRRTLRDLDADAVVTDGDLPSLLAAASLGLPVVAVGHGLVYTRCRLPPGLPRRSLLHERANSFAASHLPRRLVASHFLPAASAHADTVVARPDLAPDLAGPTSDEGFLLAYFRDGDGGPLLREATRAGRPVVCFGRLDAPPEGVTLRRFERAAFVDHLRRCAGVVASAGSSLLAECVLLGKPILALHGARDHEQRLNAAWAQAAGVAVGAPLAGADGAPLRRFLQRLDEGDFARVDLRGALPPVSRAVADAVEAVLRDGR